MAFFRPRHYPLLVLIMLFLILISCGGAEPAPGEEADVAPLPPTPTVDSEATIQAAVNATLTAQPTNTSTPRPTRTPTASPTSTPTPTPSPIVSTQVVQLYYLSAPFFFFLSLLLGKLLLNRGRKIRAFQETLNAETQKHRDQLETSDKQHQDQLASLRQKHSGELQRHEINFEKSQNESDAQIENLKSTIQKQRQDNHLLLRKQWLEGLSRMSFHNEIEVEVKFIHPLVQFLGYQEHEFELRVPCNLQLGHNSIKGEADWVLLDRNNTSFERKIFIVIEAKAPRVSLDEFHAQVRSYAFSLDAPLYVITNGKDFKVFRRGVERDECVINCQVKSLVHNWALIEKTIGAKARSRIG